MNGESSKVTSGVTSGPGSPATKRKPVPTPRSTLRKPADKDEKERRQLIINSQGQTSGESGSPVENSAPVNGGKTGGEDSEDILAALEKIPGVGSLRSLNSVGSSSQPSISLDQKFKREESSHSLASGLSLNSGPEGRKRSLGDRSRTSPRILMLNGKKDDTKLFTIQYNRSNSHDGESSVDTETSSDSPASPGGKVVSRGAEKRRSQKSVKILESDITALTDVEKIYEAATRNLNDKTIQERPLPELPPKFDADNNDENIEVVSNEEIYTALLTPDDHYQELNPSNLPSTTTNNKSSSTFASSSYNKTETANLMLPNHTLLSKSSSKRCSSSTKTNMDVHNSLPSLSLSSTNNKNYLTMTGTIKRGKNLPEKSLDIQLSVTPDHLTKLEKRVHDKYHDRCFCGLRRGPHVFLVSLLSIPFMLIYSTFQAFFLGSMTWFNIFLYYNEERTCCHKLLSPLILLFYPFWIVPITLGLGLYGGLRVVSWYWDSWIQEISNPDCGFMAWICTKMNLPDCAPYQVVLLSAEESPNHPQHV